MEDRVRDGETGMVKIENSYPLQDDFKGSNIIIRSKYNLSREADNVLTVLEHLYRAGRYEISELGFPVVRIAHGELVKLLRKKNSAAYSPKILNDIGLQLSGLTLHYDDREKQEWSYFRFIREASYKRGVFSVEFDTASKKVFDIKTRGYTPLSLSTQVGWSNKYSKRLYTILLSKAYYRGDYKGIRTGKFEFSYSVPELRVELRTFGIWDDAVRKELFATYPPNYEKACAVARDLTYPVWADFKRYVLDKARKEINSTATAEITVDFRAVFKKYGEVDRVVFTVQRKDCLENADTGVKNIVNSDGSVETVVDDLTLLEMIVKVVNIFEGVVDKDGKQVVDSGFASVLCDVSNFDLELLERVRNDLNNYPSPIRNIRGWIRDAVLRGGYDIVEAPESTKKKSPKKNSFFDFPQVEHDADYYERLKELVFVNDPPKREGDAPGNEASAGKACPQVGTGSLYSPAMEELFERTERKYFGASVDEDVVMGDSIIEAEPSDIVEVASDCTTYEGVHNKTVDYELEEQPASTEIGEPVLLKNGYVRMGDDELPMDEAMLRFPLTAKMKKGICTKYGFDEQDMQFSIFDAVRLSGINCPLYELSDDTVDWFFEMYKKGKQFTPIVMSAIGETVNRYGISFDLASEVRAGLFKETVELQIRRVIRYAFSLIDKED